MIPVRRGVGLALLAMSMAHGAPYLLPRETAAAPPPSVPVDRPRKHRKTEAQKRKKAARQRRKKSRR